MKTILLVEDDPDLRFIVADMLVSEGYQVVEADNGATAKEALNASKPIDLVLSDVQMPVMTGFDLLKYIREEIPGMPVFLMTGYANQAVTAKVHQYEPDHLLAKPFDQENLAQLLVEHFQKIAA